MDNALEYPEGEGEASVRKPIEKALEYRALRIDIGGQKWIRAFKGYLIGQADELLRGSDILLPRVRKWVDLLTDGKLNNNYGIPFLGFLIDRGIPMWLVYLAGIHAGDPRVLDLLRWMGEYASLWSVSRRLYTEWPAAQKPTVATIKRWLRGQITPYEEKILRAMRVIRTPGSEERPPGE